MINRILSHWKSNWKNQHLSERAVSLAIGFIQYLAMTLIILANAGVVMILYFEMIPQAIYFLALVYVLLLAIYTEKLFSQDRITYKLDQILMDLDHHDRNSSSPCVDELTKQVEELNMRMQQ